eukprot:Protomagalhaensia_sp_Gyna_25__1507@NODE_1772_length_1547_cov_3_890584_g1452_i0_p1_GENE_NODE_1772_length_1547_cov_3_890584_g1452_i0NODE_1772_length_1547_cov_3_890584_g1452_i0_p1_ORF_typecomplete_len365_score55_58MORN/PF02493_20/6_1e02MORN/PF02493_20/0_0035_NODE_1772_length_1547_cov_3_890584_g1452_i0601154
MLNVELTGAFHQMSSTARLQFLWSLNFVRNLHAHASFFQCACRVCMSLRSVPVPLPPPLRQSHAEPSSTVDSAGTETPAVFAAFLLSDGQVPSSPEGGGDLSVSPPQSPIIGTVESCSARTTAGSKRSSVSSPPNGVKKVLPPLPPASVCEDIAIRHSFDALTLAFQIAYRNRATLETLVFDGPSAGFSTALKRDDELPKLPFPLKPKPAQTALNSEVMPNNFGEDESKPEPKLDSRLPPKFLHLRACAFGPTVDCRYIVPFLDYSDFCKLNSVTVGRLTAEYSDMKAQFGEKATVVFAPQHIFNEQCFPSAPHLPAVYNGAIDENLRFQGKGIFVCDEYTYEGEFKDGVNHGYGRMKSRAGEQ